MKRRLTLFIFSSLCAILHAQEWKTLSAYHPFQVQEWFSGAAMVFLPNDSTQSLFTVNATDLYLHDKTGKNRLLWRNDALGILGIQAKALPNNQFNVWINVLQRNNFNISSLISLDFNSEGVLLKEEPIKVVWNNKNLVIRSGLVRSNDYAVVVADELISSPINPISPPVIKRIGFFVSTDDGKTWTPQNILSNVDLGSPQSFVEKSGQIWTYLYDKAATKLPNSTIWQPVSLPSAVNITLFIKDEQNTLWAFGNKAFSSTDNGTTWRADTASLGSSATYLKDVTLAVNGNPLILSLDSLVFKNPMTKKWEKWTDFEQFYDLDISRSYVSKVIGSGSVVFVGTSVGLFKSLDKGKTWTYSASETPARNMSVAIISSINKRLIGYVNGVFIRDENDKDWRSTNLFGNVVLVQTPQNEIHTFSKNYFIKSTDNGETWQKEPHNLPFASGLSVSNYNVDAKGNQYAVYRDWVRDTVYSFILKRTKGNQTWERIYEAPFGSSIYIQADKKGSIWINSRENKPLGLTKPALIRYDGQKWQTDTAGFNNFYTTIPVIVSNKRGDIYGIQRQGISKKDTILNMWRTLPLPSFAKEYSVQGISVNTEGVIIATIRDSLSKYHVMMTNTEGGNWFDLNVPIEAIFVQIYDDVVYAYNYTQIYYFR